MPIYGLTTTPVTNITQTLPLIARIYKGDKKTDPKRPGKELEYFRIEVEPQFRKYSTIIHQLFGDTPAELKGVYLGAPTTDHAFTAFYREWNATGLVRECDGITQTRALNPAEGRVMPSGKPCLRANGGNCGCKREANFNFIIPAFSESVNVLGSFRFTTHSAIDIKAMYEAMMGVQMLYGSLYGVPFILSRVLEEVAYVDEKTKQRKTSKHHFVKMRVDEEFVGRMGVENRLSASQTPMIAPPPNGHALPAPTYPVADETPHLVIPQTWIATNGNMERILKWASGWFKMTAEDVFEALGNDQTIEQIADYVGDNIRVSACIIAWYANGEEAKLAKICSTEECVPTKNREQVLSMANAFTADWYGVELDPDDDVPAVIE
jgi:hypothetical protein